MSDVRTKNNTYVFEDFCNCYVGLARRVVDWYDYAPGEIVIVYEAGNEAVYIHDLKALANVGYDRGGRGGRNGIGDESEEDEEERWKRGFSVRLNRRMYDRCMSQEMLAQKAGVSRVALNRYLNGHSVPSAYNLHKLAEALRCDPNDLMPD